MMRTALRIAARVVVILALAYAVSRLLDYAMTASEALDHPGGDAMMVSLLVGLLIAYALLIAVPFVPGIEIGITLLILRGADMAPAVYLATVFGLILAYGIGRLIPPTMLTNMLRDLRLRRAADLVQDFCDLPPEARLAHLNERLPKPLALFFVRARYLTLAGILNLPGNAFVGGGGGLLMLAGVTRTFHPLPTLLMVLLAVLPVPFIVWLWGPGILSR